MNVVDLIAAKRDGAQHAPDEIRALIAGITRGDVPDYQVAAWLMAVYLRGMKAGETAALTLAMAASGETLDLSDVAPLVADKHSTGGVGDKTTLVVAPLLAALGVPVGKMTGRGLGFSGGTVDKLESLPGLRVERTAAEFRDQLRRIGLVLAGQSAELAPADGILYALRDVTATVESIPLIAASIMSKKIAAGATLIGLDVKVGRGAFMKNQADALLLASTMVAIGRAAGRTTIATVTAMDQPLGRAVGNLLEVEEAVACLRGEGPADLRDLALTLTAEMVVAAGRDDEPAAREAARRALANGAAFAKLQALVEAQGGDPRDLDAPDRLPHAPSQQTVGSPRAGYVTALDAERIGRLTVRLGAGRLSKGQPIDHRVGVVLMKKIGDDVVAGEPLAVIHAASDAAADTATPDLIAAYAFGDARPAPAPLVLDRYGE